MTTPFKREDFVAQYPGELIDTKEALRREEEYDQTKKDCYALFTFGGGVCSMLAFSI